MFQVIKKVLSGHKTIMLSVENKEKHKATRVAIILILSFFCSSVLGEFIKWKMSRINLQLRTIRTEHSRLTTELEIIVSDRFRAEDANLVIDKQDQQFDKLRERISNVELRAFQN